jgi:hypothetical protein
LPFGGKFPDYPCKERRFRRTIRTMSRRSILCLALCVSLSLSWRCDAQIYDTNNVVVQTFAGSGFSGYLDGQGALTMFNNPSSIVADPLGNLFILDTGNNRIRRITQDATVSTFVGGGVTGPPGYGTNVSLAGAYPSDSYAAGAMTIDHSNVLWIATLNHTALMRVGSDAYVAVIPLNTIPSIGGCLGGICVDSVNNLYISDSCGNKIYRYATNGVVEVFAGSGNFGSVDGNGVFTSFANPSVLTSDAADNVYVWDSANSLVRRINQNRDVVTICGKIGSSADSDGPGTNAAFYYLSAMCADGAGNVILTSGLPGGAGFAGSAVRKMTAITNVSTLAGSFSQRGYTNGPGSLARFSGASGVCVSQGTIYVVDKGNQRIRQITFNSEPQIVTGPNLGIGTFTGITITGIVGRTYQIQTSPDMSSWSEKVSILLTASPYLWIDQNPISGSKFYRALLLP